jgi:hypothetical protein
MDTTWLESVGGVALGALIGSVPAGLAIRAEIEGSSHSEWPNMKPQKQEI